MYVGESCPLETQGPKDLGERPSAFGFGVQSPLLHLGPGVRDLIIEKLKL